MDEGTQSTIGIYAHIPFCVMKCPYCDFNSIAVLDIPEDRYIQALLKELAFQIEMRPELSQSVLETIYIGGGTPSLISPQNIRRLLTGIQQAFPVNRDPEITIEVNPGTVTYDQLVLFREAGINRLSIGVQSFNEKGLKTLCRIHSGEDAVRCYESARKAGFSNVGIDLIFGFPEQSQAEWGSDLEQTISLRPEHISTYNLTVEPGTPFYIQHGKDCLLLPGEDEQIRMYETCIDRLVSSGYKHYEISNFSFEDFESRHNQRYWTAMDYIGLGAGSHSYSSDQAWGRRWWNESGPLRYMQCIEKTGHAREGMESLTSNEAITEGILLGLRRIAGIDLDWFSRRFSLSLKDFYRDQIVSLERDGYLTASDNRLKLTRQGLLLSNSVITSFP